MLSANERNRAKTPGRHRIRLSSSRRMRSRTWWSRFSTPEGLAVQGDDRPARPRRRLVQPSGGGAKGRLEVAGIEGQEQVTQRVHGRSPPQAGAEGGVEA